MQFYSTVQDSWERWLLDKSTRSWEHAAPPPYRLFAESANVVFWPKLWQGSFHTSFRTVSYLFSYPMGRFPVQAPWDVGLAVGPFRSAYLPRQFSHQLSYPSFQTPVFIPHVLRIPGHRAPFNDARPYVYNRRIRARTYACVCVFTDVGVNLHWRNV